MRRHFIKLNQCATNCVRLSPPIPTTPKTPNGTATAMTIIRRQRQIEQRYCTAHGKHSRLHRIAQLDRTAEDRAVVHKILRNQVNVPFFA